MESKWLVWSLVGLGIILLVLNLFIGGDSAPFFLCYGSDPDLTP